jgi:hypothetical protein
VDDNTVGNESDYLADKGSYKGHCESRKIRFDSIENSLMVGEISTTFRSSFQPLYSRLLEFSFDITQKKPSRKVTESSTQYSAVFSIEICTLRLKVS